MPTALAISYTALTKHLTIGSEVLHLGQSFEQISSRVIIAINWPVHYRAISDPTVYEETFKIKGTKRQYCMSDPICELIIM